jgi:ribosomal protein S18 acetylase RimI-like enzyme
MMQIFNVLEITSAQKEEYKIFFSQGLINDEDHFRISINDERFATFPTKDVDDSFTLGAYANGLLIGVVSFSRDGSDREKLRHKGTLFRMYIDPNFRGIGLAKLLIKAVVNRVVKLNGIEQINLTVISNNVSAVSLYEKLGFITFAREKNAIKWNRKYFSENQMVYRLNT